MVARFRDRRTVIQSALIFLLGFLTAALAALLAAPALWRRAVRLTRKRVLASTPMTLNEIEAEKDRMRAAFAMEIRQVEMRLESARERVAHLLVDLGAAQEKARLAADGRTGSDKKTESVERDLAAARAEAKKLTAALHVANEAISRLEANQAELATRNAELGGALDEAVLKASRLDIELAERDGDIALLRTPRSGGGKTGSDEASELKALKTALAAERRRATELERKLDDRSAAKRSARPANAGSTVAEGNVLSLDMARLVADNAALREQVLELAARVVAQTAVEEGPGSPVIAALSAPENPGNGRSGLADRIRALQKSASSRRN